jgi:hypothetical protein
MIKMYDYLEMKDFTKLELIENNIFYIHQLRKNLYHVSARASIKQEFNYMFDKFLEDNPKIDITNFSAAYHQSSVSWYMDIICKGTFSMEIVIDN